MKRPAQTSPTESRLSEAILKRFNLYTLAASAAGVSAVALGGTASPAHAGIIYTPANVTLTKGTFYLDLNHDGVNDFEVIDFRTKLPYGYRGGLSGRALSRVGGFLTTSGPFTRPLKAGRPIGPKAAFRSFAFLYYFFKSQSGPYRLGFWGHASDAFLGLTFDIAGQAHYGWAEFSVDFNPEKSTITATLMGYAYDTVAGQAITAGEGKTPEPGTLGLLALGSLALGLWRRKEQAKQIKH